jgi:hypothetical protein
MRLLVVLLILFASPASLHAQTVYKTPSGKKYHLASCHMVKNVSEALEVKKAVEIGLEPCQICRPATIRSSTIVINKPQGETKKTKQCLGYTKAGSRCRHMTNIGNGYCFQHQP